MQRAQGVATLASGMAIVGLAASSLVMIRRRGRRRRSGSPGRGPRGAKIESRRPLLGPELLDDPVRNKGTAFTAEERRAYGLEGLLPHAVEGLDRQVERVMQHLSAKKGRIAEVLRNWPVRDVRFICVSTGGRILGLGDIGANGMGIPIGKLQLYTACAAVPPDCLLPMLLDVGTTSAALRADPLYLGLREPPPPTQELDELVEELVQAVQRVFPGCCIHFEDWKGTDAIRLLARY
jgi:hypothetical protein